MPNRVIQFELRYVERIENSRSGNARYLVCSRWRSYKTTPDSVMVEPTTERLMWEIQNGYDQVVEVTINGRNQIVDICSISRTGSTMAELIATPPKNHSMEIS